MKMPTHRLILLLLLIGQFISTLMLGLGYEPSNFSLEHEDTIFIMLLCTWFIVYAVDEKKFIGKNNTSLKSKPNRCIEIEKSQGE